jgi:hypothetical protein
MVSPIDNSLSTENPSAPEPQCVLQVFVPRIGLMHVVIDEQSIQTLFQRALNTWSDAPRGFLKVSDELTK